MTDYFEIIPGESIGPFKLGMTRAQIEELNIRPWMHLKKGTYYPLVDIDVKKIKYFPNPGVNVYYDTSGTCHLLQAIFRYWPSPPVFTLCGHVVNGMTQSEFVTILSSVASDVNGLYGSSHSISSGIRATKWEASDDHIMSIKVMPKKVTTSHSGGQIYRVDGG